MPTLYILGNGFDLHYGLHTSYNDMAKILATKDIYNEIGNAEDFFESLHVINWSNFEEELANFDIEEFFGDNVQYPDYLSDHEYVRDGVIWNMQDKAKSLNRALEDSLKDMVDRANADLDTISYKFPFKVSSEDAVLSFNYTSTFEYLNVNNGIPVLHIHGFAENGDSLIYGYLNPIMNKIANTEQDYYIEQQEGAVNNLYENWKKTLQMDKLDSFLESWTNNSNVPYEIKVYGHSMGSVDMPYMNEIDHLLRPVKWYISYFSGDDYWDKRNADWLFKNRVQLFKW